jgi:tetratricopeptide (TPR) repeat protein
MRISVWDEPCTDNRSTPRPKQNSRRPSRSEPESPRAYSDRSRVRSQLGKYPEAEADLNEAIARAPDESWLYIDRGRFRLNMMNLSGARSDFDIAIRLDPGYFLPYVLRGGIHDDEGRDAEALADYRKVIELYPEYWYTYESAAAAAFRLGLWSESASYFKKAYTSDNSRYEYAIAASVALWRSGNVKEAKTYAESIAPSIDRDKNYIYWAMLRLIQDQNDATADLEVKIQAAKKLDVKSAMLFYLAEYWICRGKTDLGAKYLALAAEQKREGTLEYRMIQSELKRLGQAAG